MPTPILQCRVKAQAPRLDFAANAHNIIAALAMPSGRKPSGSWQYGPLGVHAQNMEGKAGKRSVVPRLGNDVNFEVGLSHRSMEEPKPFCLLCAHCPKFIQALVQSFLEAFSSAFAQRQVVLVPVPKLICAVRFPGWQSGDVSASRRWLLVHPATFQAFEAACSRPREQARTSLSDTVSAHAGHAAEIRALHSTLLRSRRIGLALLQRLYSAPLRA